MTSLAVVRIRRRRPSLPPTGHSIRDISREYFKSEHPRFLAIEFTVFVILALIALWPILDAAVMIARGLSSGDAIAFS